MNSVKTIIVAATLSAILSGTHLAAAQAADGAQTMKPLQGISFHAGTKHAVAYFLSENRTCKFVLTTADKDAQPTRFEAALLSGESSSYEFAEGRSLEFTCEADAQAMTLTPLTTVAAQQ
jgi:hypothetical protein